MAVYQLPTGSYETRAGFAFKGGSFRDKRSFAATAILVAHPEGDFLVDADFGADNWRGPSIHPERVAERPGQRVKPA